MNLMISVISTAYEAETGPRKIIRRRYGKEHSIMKLEKYFELKANGLAGKYKIMIDSTVEIPVLSVDDVLETQRLKEKKDELKLIQDGFKRKRFPVIYKGFTLNAEQKENSVNELKWKKRMKKFEKMTMDSEIAKKILKHKKRINLPLKINSKLLKFQLNKSQTENGKLFSDPDLLISRPNPREVTVSNLSLSITYQKLASVINDPIDNNKRLKLNKEFSDYEEIYMEIRVK
jgi:hypothetical protein